MLTLETQGRQETKLKKGDLIIIGVYFRKRGEEGQTTKTSHNIWVERKGELIYCSKKDTEGFMNPLFNNVEFLPQIVIKVRAFKKLVTSFSNIKLETGTIRNFLASNKRAWGYEIPLKVISMR